MTGRRIGFELSLRVCEAILMYGVFGLSCDVAVLLVMTGRRMVVEMGNHFNLLLKRRREFI